jgi:hypothetical protein
MKLSESARYHATTRRQSFKCPRRPYPSSTTPRWRDGNGGIVRAQLGRGRYGATAIAEISILASRGNRATSTVARAGGAFLK